jgi:hypothetical protein
LLDPSFHAPQRPGFDTNSHAFPNLRRQTHSQLGFQSQDYILQLALESFLIENVK